MAIAQYNLVWNSYKNNICNGFAMLQQKAEFVDMTLVAGGHLVKVHKNIVALASPYIKHMIQSAPCEHPVIFLSSITHEILSYILEYIYTGEVNVEVDKIKSFINAATELHITGISNDLPLGTTEQISSTLDKSKKTEEVRSDCAANNNNKKDLPTIDLSFNENGFVNQLETNANSFSEWLQDTDSQNANFECNHLEKTDLLNSVNLEQISQPTSKVEININGSIPQQYTVSKRGSLQLILNRFMYCMHHQSLGGKKRRWRCIDYRLLHCPAYIDTINDQIMNRQNIHCHPYHDEKIMRNIKKNLVFGSLNVAIQKSGKLHDTNNEEIMDDND
ncbi:putative zinc finger protein and BTB domain-containing [Danaus plexippus plexippus]|uniref:Zinc finger protein and BTB domain-containing n=1 Tax=Danaus plexippus plexippus TaxID=278856 RepID=A0A212EHU3_DANPL|nr:putative zinc finger protein and BTB domain-containing [Danaus plexippus plexippus]